MDTTTNYTSNYTDWRIKNKRSDHELISRIIKRSREIGLTTLYLRRKGGGILDNITTITTGKRERKRSILIAGGFHGEEIAGPWGILYYLENIKSLGIFKRINITFIPLLNRYGFRNNIRESYMGLNCNRGWDKDTKDEERAHESNIILENIETIKDMSKDGFLTLHEDIDATKIYIYTYEKTKNPGKFSRTMRDTLRGHFNAYCDGYNKDLGNIKNGIIYNLEDGTMEEYLYQNGIPRAVCTETPGRKPLIDRIKCNAHLIDTFIRYHINLKKG